MRNFVIILALSVPCQARSDTPGTRATANVKARLTSTTQCTFHLDISLKPLLNQRFGRDNYFQGSIHVFRLGLRTHHSSQLACWGILAPGGRQEAKPPLDLEFFRIWLHFGNDFAKMLNAFGRYFWECFAKLCYYSRSFRSMPSQV